MTSSLAKATLLSCWSCVPCGAPDHNASELDRLSPDTVVADTIDGTEIVRNPAVGVWEREGVEPWRIEEIDRLGELDGEEHEVFGAVHDVSVGPLGRIWVIDFQSQDLRVYERDGTHVRTVGRRGEGPGEFDGPLGMAWDMDGRLWVADGWNARYTVFDTTGAVATSIPRPIRVSRFRQQVGFHEDGFLVDETVARRPNGPNQRMFVRVDTSGVQDTLATFDMPARTRREVTQREALLPFPSEVRPYHRSLVLGLPPDARYVWHAKSEEYRLYQEALDGDTLRIVEAVHRREGLTDEDRAFIERAFRDSPSDADPFQFARPIVEHIYVLEDGHLMVRVHEEPGEHGHAFDVFDPEGRFLGTLETDFRLSGRIQQPVFDGDEMISVTYDELDVPYIIRMRVCRGPC